MNIIIAGIQGSGKGTQSKLLADFYNLKHVSFGDTIKKLLDEGSSITNPYTLTDYRNGLLAPDETLFNVANYVLNDLDGKSGFILDGFPRTKGQMKFIKDNFTIDYTIILDLIDGIAIQRMLDRKRPDDNIEAIHKRIKQFKDITLPVIMHRDDNTLVLNKYIMVDANDSVAGIFSKINLHIK